MSAGLKQQESPTNLPLSFPANRPHFDALVLDAWTRQALSTIRSLGRRGLRVAALTTFEIRNIPAFSSRWCQQHFVCPACEGTPEYLDYLQNILAEYDVPVLIPTSDGTIELIRRYRDILEQYTSIALAAEPALEKAINKAQTLSIASALGLAVPQGICIQAGHDATEALRVVKLPAVIKPVQSWDNTGENRQESKLVTTPGEACTAVEALTREGGSVLFQQFIPGERESISLFFAQGEVLACFAHRIQRTNPPLGGTDVMRESIVPPADISDQAKRLVRAIDLEGYSLVEFRRDLAGVPYLMEINSRLSAGVELPVQAGIDFPYLCYQWASGQRVTSLQSYRTGHTMRDLGSDIATTAATFVQRGRPGVPPPLQALRHFFFSFFRPMSYDFFDARDPWPAGAAIGAWFRNIPRQISASRARHRSPSARTNVQRVH